MGNEGRREGGGCGERKQMAEGRGRGTGNGGELEKGK